MINLSRKLPLVGVVLARIHHANDQLDQLVDRLPLTPPRLTHLAEAGIQLPLLMTKAATPSLNSLAIYAKPTFDAVAAATAALDSDRRR